MEEHTVYAALYPATSESGAAMLHSCSNIYFCLQISPNHSSGMEMIPSMPQAPGGAWGNEGTSDKAGCSELPPAPQQDEGRKKARGYDVTPIGRMVSKGA